jgi:hypothetical protein
LPVVSKWLITPPRNVMSVPVRIGAYRSATEAERVKRGSITMNVAWLWALASVTSLSDVPIYATCSY